MVAAAFPVAKLGFLLIKQANNRKEYVCIPIAQAFHWYEIKLKMKTLNVGGKIIISVASTISIYEYSRSSEKEMKKEEALQQERDRIKNKIFELEFRVEKQSTQIRELARTVIHIEEDIHKRSLRRIFEQKPKLSPQLLESAEEPENKIYLVQPLEEAQQPQQEGQQQQQPQEDQHKHKQLIAQSGSSSQKKINSTVDKKNIDSLVNEGKKENVEESQQQMKKGLILSAATDILERKSK
ncbi:putative OPA3-like protein CG13603 [Eurytemora carolleeae]|uniref:putative OPA3-like protein CG13603 n=1 Tax=Eurytemora carolleeae TaxID=1294199 RepID=UPI000C77FA0C|nr:putative OPA3-like protein CG13603 [Eurytemora carolleeae]|eukprot:XP_023338463.1 putative OPA3-like protein CG13603 [Eurytemora affinis]